MIEKIEISDGQYDWLMARSGGDSTPSRVLEEVIELVQRIEDEERRAAKW